MVQKSFGALLAPFLLCENSELSPAEHTRSLSKTLTRKDLETTFAQIAKEWDEQGVEALNARAMTYLFTQLLTSLTEAPAQSSEKLTQKQELVKLTILAILAWVKDWIPEFSLYGNKIELDRGDMLGSLADSLTESLLGKDYGGDYLSDLGIEQDWNETRRSLRLLY